MLSDTPDGIRAPARAVATGRLTARQAEVVHLIARGFSNGEIASFLGISERTVRMHSDALRVKLQTARRRTIPAAYHALTGRDPLRLHGSHALEPLENPAA